MRITTTTTVLFAPACLALGIAPAPADAADMFPNIIVNGDAELGPATPSSGTRFTPFGWSDVAGQMWISPYGQGVGGVNHTTPGPPDRGQNFFWGGRVTTSTIEQMHDLAVIAPLLDSGSVDIDVSGWFGGWQSQNDRAMLTAEFRDADGVTINSATAGPVTNVHRGNVTSLHFRDITAQAPPGTRLVRLVLTAIRAAGTNNDGYSDNLSLVLRTPISEWGVDAPGAWSSPANWTGAVPDHAGAAAMFGSAISASRTVTLDAPIAAGYIAFDNASAYTLAGIHPITLNTAAAAQVTALSGSHTITAPLMLGNRTHVLVAGGSTLTVTSLSANDMSVVKRGAGLLQVNAITADELSIDAGSVRILGDTGVARVGGLQLAGDATLDLSNNAMVIDYTADTPFEQVRQWIASAYNAGAWDEPGITSSLANPSQFGLGYAEASALPSVPPIFGVVDDSAVLVRFTRYGDANLDGQVNLADFNRLAANFGTTNAVWSMGDFNYDGIVNLADFNRLAANFGLSASLGGPTPDDWAALGAAVPEPGAAAVLCGAVLLRRRRGASSLYSGKEM